MDPVVRKRFPASVTALALALAFASALLALAATLVPPAAAHAVLERSVPAAGSVMREPPERVTLWFSQRFEPGFSNIRVFDTKDEPVHLGEAEVDQTRPRQLSIALPRLPPGTYQVRWRVLSVDTHVSEGHFAFDVRP